MSKFLSEAVEFKEMFSMLDKLKEVPDEQKAKDILKNVQDNFGQTKGKSWLNHQLYQVLCLNLEGKALNTIKNLKEKTETNGVITWCKLIQDCSSMTSQRLQGLAQKVYSPKRVKNYSEVNSAIEE